MISCCLIGSLIGESRCVRHISTHILEALLSCAASRACPAYAECSGLNCYWHNQQIALENERIFSMVNSSRESKYGRTHSGTSTLFAGHPCRIMSRSFCITRSCNRPRRHSTDIFFTKLLNCTVPPSGVNKLKLKYI